MWEIDERFVKITGSIFGVWLFSWFFFISPSLSSIKKDRQEIHSFAQEIEALYSSEHSPREVNLEAARQQNQKLERTLLEYSERVSRGLGQNQSTDIIKFRSVCKNKNASIASKANRLGISLGQSFTEQQMGFSSNISSERFHAGYWISLTAADILVDTILEEHQAGNRVLAIKSLNYPSLPKPEEQKHILQKNPVTIVFSANMNSLLGFVQKISDVNSQNKYPFFRIKEVKIQQSEDTQKEKGVADIQISLESMLVNLDAGLDEEENDSVEIPTSLQKEDERPIWERF